MHRLQVTGVRLGAFALLSSIAGCQVQLTTFHITVPAAETRDIAIAELQDNSDLRLLSLYVFRFPIRSTLRQPSYDPWRRRLSVGSVANPTIDLSNSPKVIAVTERVNISNVRILLLDIWGRWRLYDASHLQDLGDSAFQAELSSLQYVRTLGSQEARSLGMTIGSGFPDSEAAEMEVKRIQDVWAPESEQEDSGQHSWKELQHMTAKSLTEAAAIAGAICADTSISVEDARSISVLVYCIEEALWLLPLRDSSANADGKAILDDWIRSTEVPGASVVSGVTGFWLSNRMRCLTVAEALSRIGVKER